MKRKLLKTFLLAAGLLVGSSAWADDVVFTQVANYNFEGETPTNPFTDNSGLSGRCNAVTYTDATTSSAALKFTGSNLSGKTYGYQVYDFSALTGSSSSVKVAFDFKIANQNHTSFSLRDASIASETNKSSYSGTGAIFKFANARPSGVNILGYNNNAVSGASYDTWYHIEIIVDVVNKKVSYTLKSFDQNTTIDTQSNLSFLSSSATACTQLDFFGIANAEMAYIDNIVVSEYTSASATTYSIEKYDTNGTLLSTTNGLAGVAGETSSATDADKANFYSADGNKKYVFDSTDERNVTSMELTSTVATNVLKLYFTANQKYTATVSSVCGENVVADITGSWYADETPVTLYWPKAVSTGEGYYVVDAEGSTPYYGHTFSTSDLTKTVTYTLDESIVYYTEYESILSDKNSYEYFPAQSSKGTSRCIQKSGVMKTAMGLASAGVYDVIIAGGNRDSGHSMEAALKLIDSEDNISTDNIISITANASVWNGEMTAEKVTIPAGSELYLANDNGTGNARFAGDYTIVRKSYVSAPITSSTGYATFSSTYALDFTGISTLTAYKATACNGTTVTLEPITGTVAPNTGLVIKGTTTNIPVVATGDEATGNLLFALDGSYSPLNAATDGGTNYVLSVQDDEAVFAPIGATPAPVTAGHAALHYKASSARTLNIVFADEATGIKSIENGQWTIDNYYDLQGRRVAQPTKGLYIMNGKKVIMK